MTKRDTDDLLAELSEHMAAFPAIDPSSLSPELNAMLARVRASLNDVKSTLDDVLNAFDDDEP